MKRRHDRRSLAQPVRLPHPVGWLALAVVAVLVSGTTALAPRYSGLLSQLGIRELTFSDPGPTLTLYVIAGFAGVAAVLALRRFLFANLARRPGPIEIVAPTTLAPETEEGRADRVLLEGVVADVRRTLATMSLAAPDLLPNEPSSVAMLDDIRTTPDRNAVAMAAFLATSLVRIRAAYRVTIQLRHRKAPNHCGLTVHVVQLPGGRGEVKTVWGREWTEVAEMAGHVVGAYVIPRSRLSSRPPWTAWRGLEMPFELFHHSQRAEIHIRERQYERALAELYDALIEDPQNPHLRITLGQVQEQLGLFLDALETYTDIVVIESWNDRRLWMRIRGLLRDDTTGAPPRYLRRNPNGGEALLIARYRMVCRLAGAEQLAQQWPQESESNRQDTSCPRNLQREDEVQALRVRLLVWLTPYVRRYAEQYHVPLEPSELPEGASHRTVLDARRMAGIEREEPRLRHLFQFIAREEADHLIDDYRWSRGRRRPGMAVTQTGLNLMRVLTRLYLDVAAKAIGLPIEDWPRKADDLDRDISWYLVTKPFGRRGWVENYNAACTVSVALRGWPAIRQDEPGRNRRKLALQAIRHLERAVSSTDSGDVGRYAQWLSAGDQDLNPLRQTKEFVDFLDRYLPSPGIRVPRPGDLLLRFVVSHHTLRLLSAVVYARVEFWSSRLEGDIEEQSRTEVDREARLTVLIERYVLDDHHWQTRLTLIKEADEFLMDQELPRLRAELPMFQDDPAVGRFAERKGERNRADPTPYFERVMKDRDNAWTRLRAIVLERLSQLRRANETTSTSDALRFWTDLGAALDEALEIDSLDRKGLG